MSRAAHGVASLHGLPLGNRAVASVEVADADRQLRQIIIQGFLGVCRRARIDQDQLGDLLRRCLREVAGSPVSPRTMAEQGDRRCLQGPGMFDGGCQSRLHALGVAGLRRILLGCGRVRLVTVRRGCLFG